MPSQPGALEENPNIYMLRSLARLNQKEEWKSGLDDFAHQVRLGLIFDHLVIYKINGNENLEPVYARAVGRGRSAEADTSWGDTIANQAILENKPVSTLPQITPGSNRLDRPYGLALPIHNGKGDPLGAVVLIRFGGPGYSNLDIEQAQGFTAVMSLLFGNQRLHKLVDDLTEQCKTAELQDNFVSNVTHELRSPLGFIKGYTTTLLRADAQWDEKSRLEFLRIIDTETDHLQDLIDNLLDSARLQSNMMEFHMQSVRVEGLINNTLARAKLHHPDLITNLHIDQPLQMIKADPGRLEQVFENLLTNSLKYAPGSPLSIDIKPIENNLLIQFHDEGPGIPQDSLEKIFWRFYRDPQSSKEARGSGLGLYICQQIIDAHKGKISVESNMGAGTTFSITLPALQQ